MYCMSLWICSRNYENKLLTWARPVPFDNSEWPLVLFIKNIIRTVPLWWKWWESHGYNFGWAGLCLSSQGEDSCVRKAKAGVMYTYQRVVPVFHCPIVDANQSGFRHSYLGIWRQLGQVVHENDRPEKNKFGKNLQILYKNIQYERK